MKKLALLLCLVAVPASAQVITPSGHARWTPPPEEDVLVDGVSKVKKYTAEVFLAVDVITNANADGTGWVPKPTAKPLYSFDWGKPVRRTDGDMDSPALQPLIAPDRSYVAFVFAIGQNDAPSPRSDGAGPFGWLSSAPPAAPTGVRILP